MKAQRIVAQPGGAHRNRSGNLMRFHSCFDYDILFVFIGQEVTD